MSVKVARNRFIVPSLQSCAALYQHLLGGISGFQELGHRLIQKAELTKAVRHTATLEEVALLLANFPIPEYQLIGQYYRALSECLKGGNPQHIFEQVLEKSQTYKARALIGLAAIEARKGNYQAELNSFMQSLKYAKAPSVILEAQRGIAVVKGKEGIHIHGVRDLERVFPLVRHVDTYAYYQYLNSFAVELGEVGRLEEAQKVCEIVLASPLAVAYPEWRETGAEISRRGYKSRSSVSVKRIPGNLLYLPEREASDTPVKSGRARVFSLEKWKEKMVKEPNGNGEQLPEDMTAQDIAMKILELITENKHDEGKLRKLMESAIKIFSEPTTPPQ